MVEVAEQQGHRFATVLAAFQQIFAGGHECAAVADAGQRIAVGGGAELQLGALLDHGQDDEGDADGIEQGLEHQQGKEAGALAAAGQGHVEGHATVDDDAHAVEAHVEERQRQGRHIGHLQALAATPELVGAEPGVTDGDQRTDGNPHGEGVVEGGIEAEQRPDRRAGANAWPMRLAPGEHAHGGPGHRRAEMQHDVAQHQGQDVHADAAQTAQHGAEDAEQQCGGQVAEGRLAAATAPGVEHEDAHQGEDVDIHQHQGGDVQLHEPSSRRDGGDKRLGIAGRVGMVVGARMRVLPRTLSRPREGRQRQFRLFAVGPTGYSRRHRLALGISDERLCQTPRRPQSGRTRHPDRRPLRFAPVRRIRCRSDQDRVARRRRSAAQVAQALRRHLALVVRAGTQ
ncbi:hypothetical protein D3C76_957850 [compost metagenome]